ncbi:MAG: hypothetical protein ACOC8F_05200 [Planctomycetota bacterium]
MNAVAMKNQFVGELRANKRKAVVLVVLAAVALVLVVRLMVGDGRTPQRAGADVPTVANTSGGLLSAPGGAQRVRQARQDRRDRYLERFDAAIRRDLFTPNADYFPQPEPPPEPETTKPEQQTEPAASPTAEEIRRAQIRRAAQRLELQTTFVSSSPTAMIDGKVLGPGDRIKGFEVVRITSQACVVRKDDVETELKLRP